MYIGQAGIWSALAGQCKYDKLSVANISVLRHEEEIVAFHLRGTENKTCCSVCVCVCACVLQTSMYYLNVRGQSLFETL